MKKWMICAALALVSLSAAHAADIVDTAVSAGQFTTLVKAVQAAGLVDTLKGAGPFTVFAPTDAAFAKLPAGALDSLIANPDKLKAVLTYHVVSGKVMAAQVKPGKVKTVNGAEAMLTAKGGKVMIDKATVVKADIVCDRFVNNTLRLIGLHQSNRSQRQSHSSLQYTTPKFIQFQAAATQIENKARGLRIAQRSKSRQAHEPRLFIAGDNFQFNPCLMMNALL